MKEALDLRLQILGELAKFRGQIIQQVQPETPTKALEALNLLKTVMQTVAGKLADPEPSPVTISEQQKQLALAKAADAIVRPDKLKANLQRIETALLTDPGGGIIFDWSDKQKADAQTYVTNEIKAIKDAIDVL